MRHAVFSHNLDYWISLGCRPEQKNGEMCILWKLYTSRSYSCVSLVNLKFCTQQHLHLFALTRCGEQRAIATATAHLSSQEEDKSPTLTPLLESLCFRTRPVHMFRSAAIVCPSSNIKLDWQRYASEQLYQAALLWRCWGSGTMRTISIGRYGRKPVIGYCLLEACYWKPVTVYLLLSARQTTKLSLLLVAFSTLVSWICTRLKLALCVATCRSLSFLTSSTLPEGALPLARTPNGRLWTCFLRQPEVLMKKCTGMMQWQQLVWIEEQCHT